MSGLIEEQLPNLSEERAFEIDDGAELTSEELEALRTAMTGTLVVAFTSRFASGLCMRCLSVRT